MLLTYRYRVKSLNGHLNEMARAVNVVWNYCNDTQKHALRWNKPWPNNFDLDKLTAGSGKLLGLHSGTVQEVSAQYFQSRKQKNRPSLRYRGEKSLGWIPIKGGRDLKRKGEAFRFAGKTFRVFNPRPLPKGEIRCGSSFSQDARGNWYLNVIIKVADAQPRPPHRGVGIDLGLKEEAVLSTGEKIENPRYYREIEDKIAVAQRAGKKKRVKKLHAEAANKRKDHHHKLTTRLVREYDYIAVGNVSSSQLTKTRMAKSVHDVSWSSTRNMIRYKAIAHGAWYEEVDEKYTTQTCSHCGAMPPERPRGIAGLGIRQWTCSDCGTVHDRDVNAARNILLRHSKHPACATIEGVPSQTAHPTPVRGIERL